MSNRFLYIAWGILYAICAGLGFIPAPQGLAAGLMIFFSLVFFIFPAVLLYRAVKSNDQLSVRRIRNIALAWLITATVVICLNILSVTGTALFGKVVYYILILVTAPMVCGQHWIISLFLWSLLLITSWNFIRKK